MTRALSHLATDAHPLPVSQAPVKPVGIRDVAKRAGVSAATVSLVLSGNPRISRATAHRVRLLVEQMNYHPNRAALALQKLPTQTLSVVLPVNGQLADSVTAQIVDGIRAAAEELNYRLVLQPSLVEADDEADGLLAVDSVFIETQCVRAVWQAATYLKQLGHQRIGLIYAATLDFRGPKLVDRFAHALPACGGLQLLASESAEAIPKAGAQAASRLLACAPNITAIITADDRIACGALHQLRTVGLRVPSQVSVIALADTGAAESAFPAITSIRLPLREMGHAACRRLVHQLQGRITTENDYPDAHLIVRSSTAAKPSATAVLSHDGVHS